VVEVAAKASGQASASGTDALRPTASELDAEYELMLADWTASIMLQSDGTGKIIFRDFGRVTPEQASIIMRCVTTIDASIDVLCKTAGAAVAHRLLAAKFAELQKSVRNPAHAPKKKITNNEVMYAWLAIKVFKDRSARSLGAEWHLKSPDHWPAEFGAIRKIERWRKNQRLDPNYIRNLDMQFTREVIASGMTELGIPMTVDDFAELLTIKEYREAFMRGFGGNDPTTMGDCTK